LAIDPQRICGRGNALLFPNLTPTAPTAGIVKNVQKIRDIPQGSVPGPAFANPPNSNDPVVANDSAVANDPVAALLVTKNPRLRQVIFDLATSAGVRVHLTSEVSAPLLPRAPLCIYGTDSQHQIPAVPTTSTAALIHVDSPNSVTAIARVPASSNPQTSAPGKAHAEYFLPAQEREVLRLLTHAANTACRMATVICVHGVIGGGGCTTTALLLAGAAAYADHDATLIEVGGSPPALELALGLENASGPRWSDLTISDGSLRDLPHPDALRLALPRWRSLGILAQRPSDPVPNFGAISEVISSLARLPGIVILDGGTPHSRSPAHAAEIGADISLLVVPRTVTAVVQAHDVIQKQPTQQQPLVITRGRSGGILSKTDVGRALSVDVLTEVPTIPHLQHHFDRGTGLPGPRARFWNSARALFEAVLEAVAARPSTGTRTPQFSLISAS